MSMGDTRADSQTRPPPAPLEEALDDDDNVLVPLRYPELRDQLFDSIEAQKADIEAMIRLQMGVSWCHLCVREI